VSLAIPDFTPASVLVVGDVMLDEYWFGDAGRISPEAPVPVVKVVRREDRPGGAANVAVNLASLGVKTTLLGVIGDDDKGRALELSLAEHGVHCELLRAPDRQTIHKLRVLARSQQLIRLDAEQTLDGLSAEILSRFKAHLPNAEAVVFSDYGKGSLEGVAQLIETSRAAGIPTLVDPKGTDFDRYRGATLITPNFAEFQAVVGPAAGETELLALATALCGRLELASLLVTRGSRGMTLVEANGESVSLAAESREVFDVTGAGDTVIALMAASLALGLNGQNSATLANLAAGLVVRKVGAGTVTPGELRAALHRRGTGGRGMVSREQLLDYVAIARSGKEKLVMTNGCFDLLHAGHVAYLEEAKTLGDRLIVAVNDDASVTRLKGAGRPVNVLSDRLAVLAGLAAVDWVVPFAEDTPAELIAAVLPDVLVKGGDYRADQVVGGAVVTAAGGEVRILNYRPGRSTSGMIDAIKQR
jgi:D-beta-D-heptose 7-phosphate kinase/D-beta-D-heptose 1-phosphate adenosyltransferase